MQKKKIDPKVLKTIVIFAVIETVIVALLVAADILTKYFAFKNVSTGEGIKYLGGFLTITAVKNTGASFGIFGSSTVALTIVSFLCSLLVYAFSIYTERTRTPLLRAALAFVLAGAVGNLIDRFFLGYVRDMIQLSIFPWVFNVADAYLTVGVILILIYVVFFYSRDKERADKRKVVSPANGSLTAEGLRVAEKDTVESSEIDVKKGGFGTAVENCVKVTEKSGAKKIAMNDGETTSKYSAETSVNAEEKDDKNLAQPSVNSTETASNNSAKFNSNKTKTASEKQLGKETTVSTEEKNERSDGVSKP